MLSFRGKGWFGIGGGFGVRSLFVVGVFYYFIEFYGLRNNLILIR